MDLYTNRSAKGDFVKHGFIHNVENDMDVFIATAFFTEFSVIDDLIARGCHIRIVVRLGFPTSPLALDKLLQHNNVEARYFTSNSFHPKLYIFGDKTLLVGSANLTSAALLTNQEVTVGINSDDSRFDELRLLFSEYWAEARVLDNDAIKKYRIIYDRYSKAAKLIKDMENDVIETIGDFNFSNVNRGKKKSTKKSIFLDTYKKSYQESVSAYKRIEEVYKTFVRKVDEDSIPLRLEIDSFFSFVRDYHATKESWEHQPLGWSDNQKARLRALIDEWLMTYWEHLEDRIVPINYPLIKRIFSSSDSIKAAKIEEIVEALCVLHSFHDRFRFYKGGLETLKAEFIQSNDVNQVKKTLIHLLHGKGNIVNRMSDCIHEDEYWLNEFGQANMQELVGWINKEGLPVINGRTTKVLRYFGNDIRQLK
jgi:hypothetical protein